jgi:hypothetical protein
LTRLVRVFLAFLPPGASMTAWSGSRNTHSGSAM